MRRLVLLCVVAIAAAAHADVKLPRPERVVVSASLVEREVETHAAGQQWTTGAYVYDGTGNIAQTLSGSESVLYRYDGRNRLAHAELNADVQDFTYDAFGNLMSATAGGLRHALKVDAATNRLQASGACDADVCHYAGYDDGGNVTTSGTVSFQWDAQGALRRRDDGGTTAVHVYDAGGERVASAIVAAGNVDWRYTPRGADQKVLREFRKEFVNGHSLWSWREDWVYRGSTLHAALVNGQTRHFHVDPLGSPRLVTNQNGVRIALSRFRAFGGETPDSQYVDERIKFTGHERDDAGPNDARDLDYMHARYYDPSTARFLSPDPTWESADARTPLSWNRYAYVMNNPIRATDPDGRVGRDKPATKEEIEAAARRVPFSAAKTIRGQDIGDTMMQGPVAMARRYGILRINAGKELKVKNVKGGAALSVDLLNRGEATLSINIPNVASLEVSDKGIGGTFLGREFGDASATVTAPVGDGEAAAGKNELSVTSPGVISVTAGVKPQTIVEDTKALFVNLWNKYIADR